MSGEDAREAALKALSVFGPEYLRGAANHGPMVIDALVAMDRADAIAGFLGTADIGMLEPPPPPVSPLAGDLAGALGRIDRFTDLAALVGAELEAAPWRAVLARWVLRLAPGVSAAAFHGLLRTAHACRALSVEVTPRRLGELAQGLAYWAARFAPLPVATGARRGMTPAAALRELEPLDDALSPGPGRIQETLAARAPQHAELAGAIDGVDLSGDPGAVALAMGAAAAEMLVGFEQSRSSWFALLHGVTSMGAVSLLVPLLPEDAARPLLRHAWHGLAALRVSFAGTADARTKVEGVSTLGEVTAAAVASLDDHRIKLTECCARGLAAGGGDVFLAAARRA